MELLVHLSLLTIVTSLENAVTLDYIVHAVIHNTFFALLGLSAIGRRTYVIDIVKRLGDSRRPTASHNTALSIHPPRRAYSTSEKTWGEKV